MTITEEHGESRTARLDRRHGALGAVALLAASNVLTNRVLPPWAYVPWNLLMVAAVIVIARRAGYGFAGVGLSFRRWHRPVGVGLLLVACTGAVFAIGLLLPGTRSAFTDARVADTGLFGMLYHVLVRIPLGTVLLEEIAFRGVLPTLFGGNPAVVWRWRPVLGASALFGAWHILPSTALTNGNAAVHTLFGGSALLTTAMAVLATLLVGVLLCLTCRVGRGLKTSMLVHWATNSLGFVAAWLAVH